MGVSVEEGTVVEWLKAVGDEVAEGDVICAIATDKVDVEVEAPAAGVLAKIVVAEGENVPVGEPLCEMAVGADAAAAVAAAVPEAGGVVGGDSADATRRDSDPVSAGAGGASRRVSGDSPPTTLRDSGTDEARSRLQSHRGGKLNRAPSIGRPWAVMMSSVLVVLAVVCGYPIQRHYLQKRYADPSFTTPGLNAAFAWSRDISGARIATTSTRQYPLFGTDLSNQVQFIGTERPHGGFEDPNNCPEWRRLLNKGHYNYVVTSKDRIEPNAPQYPQTTRWTEAPQAEVVLKKPPTVVFKLTGDLDPSACPS
jgi:pyruvate/2-oxoglutarate dehydrogenase complex dihydrolipoamide acyltransferase (E2) component